MKTKKLMACLCSLLLVLVSVLSLALPSAAATAVGLGDFSRPGSQYTKTETAADILERLICGQLGEAERDYLVAFGDSEIKYDDGITTSYIVAEYHRDNKRLEVRAEEYSYLTEGGVRVVWVPKSASMGDSTLSLLKEADGGYFATFDSVDDSDPEACVSVVYTLEVVISADTANFLINKAYNDAPRLKEEIAEKQEQYNAAILEYEIRTAEYESYLGTLAAYERDSEEYREYLNAYRAYSEACERYSQYLADLASYEAAKKAREEYLIAEEQYVVDSSEYASYVEEYNKYLAEMRKYDAYLSEIEVRQNRLDIFVFADQKMTDLKRSVRAAVNGEMVGKLLQERELLESEPVGIPAATIDMAERCTANLRQLLKDYYALTTDVAKYNYYCAHYEGFRDNFLILFATLDYFYTNRAVLTFLVNGDYDRKYRIMLAQMFLVCLALSDKPVKSLDPSYVKGAWNEKTYVQYTYPENPSDYKIDVKQYTIKQIIGEEYTLTDTNKATPIETGWPAYMEEPVPPTAVEKPEKPAYVAPPEEVDEVPQPGAAPTEVENPGEPPEVVEEPVMPELYQPSAEAVALIKAYDAGLISLRDVEFTDDVTLFIERAVNKKFIDAQTATVIFYDTDGRELYRASEIDSGTAADYGGVIPTKPEDARAVYSFAGWQDATGERVDLSCIEGDMLLYPYFEEKIKSYTVTWNVDGLITEQVLEYGTEVAYPGAPTKPDDSLYRYVFVGWDKEPEAVTADAKYTAQFRPEYIVPTTDGGAHIATDGNNLTIDFVATSDAEYRIDEGLLRAGGGLGLVLNTRYVMLSFSATDVAALIEGGAHTVSVAITKNGSKAYKYAFIIRNAAGETLESSYKIGVSLSSVSYPEPGERLKLYYHSPDGRRYIKYSVSDSRLLFTAISGYTYELGHEYSITAASTTNVTVSVGKNVFFAGESVPIHVSLLQNMRIVRLYYRDLQGNEIALSADGFVMPENDITIVADAEYPLYEITFVNSGVPITTVYCYHGQIPVAPESPKKAADKDYTYTFKGWSPELSEATDNTIYTAVFESVPKVKTEVKEKLSLYHVLIIVVFSAVFLLLGGIVIAIIRHIRGYY